MYIYNADMIMREYNHLRGELGQSFSYRDIKPVYLIILMEQSPDNFLKVSPNYFHQIKHVCSSGAMVKEVSKTYYISLDTFDKCNHNINTDREAWLTFLSTTDIAKIIKLVNERPDYLELYDEMKRFRANPKELIGMISEMIATLDHNTIMYMVDEMKEQLSEKEAQLNEKEAQLNEKEAQLNEKDAQISEMENIVAELKAQIKELKGSIC